MHDLDMSTSNDGLVVRKANSYDDLKFLSELLDEEDFAMGQNRLRCTFSCDPSGFFVGELCGKTISYISLVCGLLYGGRVVPW